MILTLCFTIKLNILVNLSCVHMAVKYLMMAWFIKYSTWLSIYIDISQYYADNIVSRKWKMMATLSTIKGLAILGRSMYLTVQG